MRSNPEDGYAYGQRLAFAKDFQARMERETAAKREQVPSCRVCGSEGGKAGIGAVRGMCAPCELRDRKENGDADTGQRDGNDRDSGVAQRPS